jgi:hypothetical protein
MFVSEHLHAEVETVQGAGRLDLRRGTKPLRDDVLDLISRLRRSSTRCVLRDRLHEGGDAREYAMAFVEVPELRSSVPRSGTCRSAAASPASARARSRRT